MQRTTYSFAGQAMFLRIRTLEDGVEVDKRLYAMHTDHLGSTTVLSYLDPAAGTAAILPDSRALYEPFGEYRLEPTGEYTDRGYTGHLGNNSGSNDIGLIYMNARYYVPYLNRFLSADTIVPDPTNSQSYNHYSYTRNNPLNFIDPTGHSECGVGQYQCEGEIDRFAELKSGYQEGDEFVFGPSGSSGVTRYVELDINFGPASIVLPFRVLGGGRAVFDPLGVTVESGVGAYWGLGGAVTGQLDASSFSSPHLSPIFEGELGRGLDVTLAGLELGGRKSVIWNSEGTQSIEYAGSVVFATGAGGVEFDPNAVVVRPTERLSNALASGEDDAWQKLHRNIYGPSSVVPSGYSLINKIHSDPIFPDYGGFLPIIQVYR